MKIIIIIIILLLSLTLRRFLGELGETRVFGLWALLALWTLLLLALLYFSALPSMWSLLDRWLGWVISLDPPVDHLNLLADLTQLFRLQLFLLQLLLFLFGTFISPLSLHSTLRLLLLIIVRSILESLSEAGLNIEVLLIVEVDLLHWEVAFGIAPDLLQELLPLLEEGDHLRVTLDLPPLLSECGDCLSSLFQLPDPLHHVLQQLLLLVLEFGIGLGGGELWLPPLEDGLRVPLRLLIGVCEVACHGGEDGVSVQLPSVPLHLIEVGFVDEEVDGQAWGSLLVPDCLSLLLQLPMDLLSNLLQFLSCDGG